MISSTRTYKAVDLFCGAGGMSEGARQSGRVDVQLAVNHCRTAVFSHQNNHPETRHICARVEDMDIRSDKTVPDDLDALFAGIECVFHSNARGSAPIDDQRRSSAWRVLDWMEAKRFDVCVFENVREFLDWGPIDDNRRKIKSRKGEIFAAWRTAIEALGYIIEWKVLNAADYGAATKRLRLFIQCRRDGKPINWPEPILIERPKGDQYQPGVHWKPAHEIIDWTKKCPSVFDRKKMLVDKTLRRIRIGLLKFVRDTPCPFVVAYHGGVDPKRDGTKRQHSVEKPLPTIDTQPRFGVCEPYGVNMKGESDAFSIDSPSPTITAGAAHAGVAQPFCVKMRGTNDASDIGQPTPTITAGGNHLGLSQPYLVPQFGERDTQTPRSHSVDEPAPTVTSHGAGALVQPFLLKNGSNGLSNPKYAATFDPENPTPTIMSRNYHGVIQPYVVDVNHGESGGSRTNNVDDPLGTLTTRRGKAVTAPFTLDIHGENWTENSQRDVEQPMPTVLAKPGNSVAIPYMVKFYGTATVASVECPCPTVTARDRFALATAQTRFGTYSKDFIGPVIPIFELDNATFEMKLLIDTMTRLGVYDIGFRMLDCDELAKAQGFPDNYELHGSKKEQMRQIGNAVCPPLMKALCAVL